MKKRKSHTPLLKGNHTNLESKRCQCVHADIFKKHECVYNIHHMHITTKSQDGVCYLYSLYAQSQFFVCSVYEYSQGFVCFGLYLHSPRNCSFRKLSTYVISLLLSMNTPSLCLSQPQNMTGLDSISGQPH